MTRPARSIAWRIFGLVIASVLAATLVLFAVTFNGPPARIAPLSIEDAAHALRTGTVPASYGRPDHDPHGPRRPHGPFDHGHPPLTTDLLIGTGGARPAPRASEHADRRRADAIADVLGTSPGNVVAFVSDQPAEFQLTMVGSVTLGWTNGHFWRVVRTPVPPLLSRWHIVTLSAMLATLLLLSAFGWWIARAIARPLEQIAVAAGGRRQAARYRRFPRAVRPRCAR